MDHNLEEPKATTGIHYIRYTPGGRLSIHPAVMLAWHGTVRQPTILRRCQPTPTASQRIIGSQTARSPAAAPPGRVSSPRLESASSSPRPRNNSLSQLDYWCSCFVKRITMPCAYIKYTMIIIITSYFFW